MKQNHGYREQTSGCQRGGRIEIGGGTEWEMGVSRCQLIYRMDKQQGPSIYSTENYIQCPMINIGKNIKKKYMYN